MPREQGKVIRSDSQDKSLAAYKQTIKNDLTIDALADNTRGRYTKYDVGVWLGLAKGDSPGLLVVATTLPQGQGQKHGISSHGWIVQKYQWFCFRIVDGQRIAELSGMADAGCGYYYPEISIQWTPALQGATGQDTDEAHLTALTLKIKGIPKGRKTAKK